MEGLKRAHGDRVHGYSVVELLVVVAIVAVVATFTLLALNGRRLHNTDDQAYIVLDFMKEARQRAITQREPMRVEINRDLGTIRLMNENSTTTANDDEVIRTFTFTTEKQVIYDRAPQNMDDPPGAVSPVPTLAYAASVHPTSTPDQVATLRFLPNGNVTDAGATATGTNATVTGATIYFWTATKDSQGAFTENAEVLRAITILGASGNTSYRICPIEGAGCDEWR